MRLTRANAPEVAGTAADTTNAQAALSGVGVAGGGTGNAVAADAGRAVALSVRAKALSHRSQTDSQPCARAGWFNSSATDADDNDVPSAGDTVSVTFVDCDDGEGDKLNGIMFMRFVALSGDLEDASGWSFTVDTTMTNLRVDTTHEGAVEIATLNGDMLITASQPSISLSRGTISGDNLRIEDDGDASTLTGFNLTFEWDASTAAYRHFGEATTTNAALGGTFKTEIPEATAFRGTGEKFPHAGQMKVTGLNSGMVVTAIDSMNVRVEIDSNGDSVVDSQHDVTWDSLDSVVL